MAAIRAAWCVFCSAWLLLDVATSALARPTPSPPPASANERADFLDIRPDGGYRFAYSTGDAGRHYHSAAATADNTVSGRFGSRDPKTGGDLQTTYTAGQRGFRARGPHIARRMDLSQNKIPYNPPVSPDSPHYNPTYSSYHDPNEDPSYSFGFRTPSYSRSEASNSQGDVTGRYSFIDDVGVRHNVEYEAGSGVGFHVKTPYPDSTPLGPNTFFAGPPASKKGGKPLRGHTAILRGKDGSYRFTAAGPDQRRDEISDSTGHVRGSYTYVDDKGVQRTTQYIAGPNIGYKVINSNTNDRYPVYPYLPPYPPYVPPYKDSDGSDPFTFDTAASGSGSKPAGGNKPGDEDPWPGLGGSSTTSTTSAPSTTTSGGVFGSGDSGEGGSDGFGSSGSDGSVSYPSSHSSIPYGNCCKLKPSRHSREQEDYLGFPSGHPVRAHVQSIDLKPYGSRVLSPGAAIELPQAFKARRGASDHGLSLELEAPQQEADKSLKFIIRVPETDTFRQEDRPQDTENKSLVPEANSWRETSKRDEEASKSLVPESDWRQGPILDDRPAEDVPEPQEISSSDSRGVKFLVKVPEEQRREADLKSEEGLSLEFEVPDPDTWGGKFRREVAKMLAKKQGEEDGPKEIKEEGDLAKSEEETPNDVKLEKPKEEVPEVHKQVPALQRIQPPSS